MAISLALETVLAKSERKTFSSSMFVSDTKASVRESPSSIRRERLVPSPLMIVASGSRSLKVSQRDSFCSMILTEMFISSRAFVR